jgi:hypothetical protein
VEEHGDGNGYFAGCAVRHLGARDAR